MRDSQSYNRCNTCTNALLTCGWGEKRELVQIEGVSCTIGCKGYEQDKEKVEKRIEETFGHNFHLPKMY